MGDIANTENISNNENKVVKTQETLSYEEVKNALDIKVVAKVGNDVLKNNDKVNEKEIIKYEVKVTNNSQKEISGISIQGQVL